MKLRKNKKGFTIVELVIVIAVIGVLAAILIPTFISLSDKARKASDDSLVTNLNKALSAQERDPKDEKNLTLDDAVVDLESWGYKLPELVSRSGEELLWNQDTNRFVLSNADEVKNALEADPNGRAINYWALSNNIPAEQKFSIYPSATWEGPSQVEVTVGFDAGRRTDITKVSYVTDLEQNVRIRTNGGSLYVDARNSTLKRLGKADSVEIVHIKDSSYHESGEVGYIKLAGGRLVVEESCRIDGVYLVADENGTFDGLKIALVGNAKRPPLARSDVSLESGQSKLVVEVQSLTTSEGVDLDPEYIWISKVGDVVSSTVSSSNDAEHYSEHVVDNPTPAAEAIKEEAREGATPIDNSCEARINAVGYATLNAALTAAKDGDTVYLLKDIAVNSMITVNKNITVDGNGKRIASTKGDSNNYAMQVVEGTDKVTVNLKNFTLTSSGYQVAILTNCDLHSNVNIDNVDITCDGECIYANGLCTVNVTNGTFAHQGEYQSGKDVVYYTALIVGYGAELNVKNCDVESFGNGVATFPSGGSVTLENTNITVSSIVTENAGYALWSRNEDYTTYPEYCRDSVITFVSGTVKGGMNITDKYTSGDKNIYDAIISLTGGTFYQDPSTYVADGYTAISNGDGTWTVTRAS